MDRDERRSFLRWTEEASDGELEKKAVQLTAFIPSLSEEGARTDAGWLFRVLEREMAARREVRS